MKIDEIRSKMFKKFENFALHDNALRDLVIVIFGTKHTAVYWRSGAFLARNRISVYHIVDKQFACSAL